MSLQCKYCGGMINVSLNEKVCTCPYCGNQVSVPNVSDERHLELLNRANHLRMKNDFTNAIINYESIIQEFKEDAEAHFGLVLAKYGIEYVKDPVTGSLVPTCHRTTSLPILEDIDYLDALKYADVVQRKVYEEAALKINAIQNKILEISQKEELYDIFISYKETDEVTGERSIDSLLASDIYNALTKEGYKVFFARISLEKRLGELYEPIIYSALRSSKVMLCVGTSLENYQATWVKNEWSRYLRFMENDHSKYLIPCYKNMSVYDLPKEFLPLQAQDMGKVGAFEDLLYGLKKIFKRDKQKDSGLDSYLKRADVLLEAKNYSALKSVASEIRLNYPKNVYPFLYLLAAKRNYQSLKEFEFSKEPLLNEPMMAEALKVIDSESVEVIKKLEDKINNNLLSLIETTFNNHEYTKTIELASKLSSDEKWQYLDEANYQLGLKYFKEHNLKLAKIYFSKVSEKNYKDSNDYLHNISLQEEEYKELPRQAIKTLKAKHAAFMQKEYLHDYFNLPRFVSLILAIFPLTGFILGIVMRVKEKCYIGAVLRLLFFQFIYFIDILGILFFGRILRIFKR